MSTSFKLNLIKFHSAAAVLLRGGGIFISNMTSHSGEKDAKKLPFSVVSVDSQAGNVSYVILALFRQSYGSCPPR